ncbi:low molecular weight protein arginine phosphatase [Alkalibacter rhizosphaerae]|uniref:Low molecular weight protein arginine phosphatase n=1 Tax=Alkalibacter rhizosphaerae TaxID=2815577 RepID=A0A974XJ36_9FIRM|nr:low molecular weight protein arginine phosphatase [Alkalibacter rhizosphaerae]QSX09318.1 low molecular weight protein arginine phosphatase [Alkalibacter rhizosphaerae]
MKKVLLVCTGNTCRSSMAKGLLEHLLQEEKRIHAVEVDSAGTSVYFPEGANSNAIAVLKEWGIDISGHVAKQVDEYLIANADLVLTMTTSQKNMLQSTFPGYAFKITTLKEQAQVAGHPDILDPYGASLAVYKKTAEELKEILHHMVCHHKI